MNTSRDPEAIEDEEDEERSNMADPEGIEVEDDEESASMVNVFLTVPRTVAEVEGLTATIKGADRVKLTATEREKLHVAAVSTLPTKFGLLSMSDSTAQLQNTYNVTMRIHEFYGKLLKYDMHGQFIAVVKPNPANPAQTLAAKCNVLEDYTKMNAFEVRASNKYYKEYGPGYMLQNLLWSQELLENSCEASLRDKVTEQMLNVPIVEQGGPLFYLIMIKVITSTTEEATRAMVRKLTTMKITEIQGEDVDKAISNIRTAITRLRTVDQVPSDIKKLLIEIFQKTSVPGFNDVFKALDNSMRIGLASGPAYDVEGILQLAETTYHEFNERGEWTSSKSSGGSSFLTCWNCGEEGHVRSECTKPHVPQAGRGGRDGRGGGRFGAGRGRFGRGRGRWRGGRGGRNEEGRGRSRGPGRERGVIDAMTRPPQVRGQNQQNFNGVPHQWCHSCTRWMPDHGTRTHGSANSASTTPQGQNHAALAMAGAPFQVSPHTTFQMPASPEAQFSAVFQGTNSQYSMSGN